MSTDAKDGAASTPTAAPDALEDDAVERATQAILALMYERHPIDVIAKVRAESYARAALSAIPASEAMRERVKSNILAVMGEARVMSALDTQAEIYARAAVAAFYSSEDQQ